MGFLGIFHVFHLFSFHAFPGKIREDGKMVLVQFLSIEYACVPCIDCTDMVKSREVLCSNLTIFILLWDPLFLLS